MKYFLGPAELRPNMLRTMQKLPAAKWLWPRALTAEVLVRLPGRARYGQQSRLPFGDPQPFPRRGNLSTLVLRTLCKKAMGAEAESIILSFGGLGMCYLLVSRWR